MSSPLTHGGRGAAKAFTLIELLTVITIIGILAGVTFAVVRSVGDKGRIGRTQAELGVLAAGMEEYRRYFGDYLHVISSGAETAIGDDQIDPTPDEAGESYNPTVNDRAYNFFRALNGRISPDHTIVTRQISLVARARKYAKPFIDVSRFTLERDAKTDSPAPAEILPMPDTAPGADDPDFANALLDPWGNRYIYFYKENAPAEQAKWKRQGFVLLSAGPDGKVKFKAAIADRKTGDVIDDTAAENRDNIYATP